MSDRKKKDKKKKKQSVLEAEIFRFMEKSLKSAIALREVIKKMATFNSYEHHDASCLES